MRLYPFVIAAALFPTPAFAQRTDDNATTQAEDAFGKSVGNEQIGIYNPFDVRGFSPVEAGNVRLEGLYIDQQADFSDRLVDSSTVHVGISAQGYPFPAPTGIADYSLRKPGADPLTSVVLRYGPFGPAVDAELDLQRPLIGDALALAAGASLTFDRTNFAATPNYFQAAIIPVWKPAKGVEIIPFWSTIRSWSQEAQTIVFTDGDHLPPEVERGRYIGQPWAKGDAVSYNYGLIVKAPLAGFDLKAGVFRSIFEGGLGFADILLDVAPTGQAADRLIVVDKDNRFGSVSGELSVSRHFDEGPRRHVLIASLRARDQRRRYGGSDEISLGPTIYGAQDFRPEPDFIFGPKTHEEVRQTTLGLGYQLRWRDVGEFGAGIQKTSYRKEVTDPDPAIQFPASRASPWLFNATAAVTPTDRLAFYASYTRGLEESPVAPVTAVNRNEAPPAIRTEQKDAGVRWEITPKLTAIAGVFDVRKPYFNLDSALRFRQLGALRHRGIELSLAGEILPGLNIVAGTLFLDAEVTGEEVAAGLIGPKPVGAIERTTIVSIDYRPPSWSDWSFDALLESTGDRIANSANTLVVPPRAVLSLGTRYRFTIGKARMLLRAQVGNIFNKYGFGVAGSGFFVYNAQRRFSLTLAADF